MIQSGVLLQAAWLQTLTPHRLSFRPGERGAFARQPGRAQGDDVAQAKQFSGRPSEAIDPYSRHTTLAFPPFPSGSRRATVEVLSPLQGGTCSFRPVLLAPSVQLFILPAVFPNIEMRVGIDEDP
jgi:hypothetical protein